MKKLLLLLLLLTTGCVHASIKRIDRHSREVFITSVVHPTKHRMYMHLMHRAERMKCKKMEVVEIGYGYIKGICWDR